MSVDLEALAQARWEQYCLVLQLSNEHRRWSTGKCLFLWRVHCDGTVTSTDANTARAVSVSYLLSNPSYKLCSKFHTFNEFGEAILILSTQFVMELRVYAMYGNSRTILALFVSLTVAEIGWWIALLILRMHYKYSGTDTNSPVPGLIMCADAALPHKAWSALFDATMLVIECVILGLALHKTWQHQRDATANPFITQLARESVMYFVTLDQLATGFRNVIPVILVNRLMISVRQTVYERNHEFSGYNPPPTVAYPDRSQGLTDFMELRSFE
ncbi:hypothetical protein OE88DRAFT_1645926 [Heliocybe sulcata]|uniref:Uncharacterized protein n=1 Tax=Heliocybe sulcata TaxID=5364 RepID=A0A5C3MYF5_9AGAM|nr:hypothetical protein OE88DRAFT_1645926 [Heliocybe sulcata]